MFLGSCAFMCFYHVTLSLVSLRRLWTHVRRHAVLFAFSLTDRHAPGRCDRLLSRYCSLSVCSTVCPSVCNAVHCGRSVAPGSVQRATSCTFIFLAGNFLFTSSDINETSKSLHSLEYGWTRSTKGLRPMHFYCEKLLVAETRSGGL